MFIPDFKVGCRMWDVRCSIRYAAGPDRDWGYGFQWWRLDRGDVAIWAGLGYGGQYLLVIPEHDLIGVVNSWNIFGRRPSILGPFLDALLRSATAGPGS